MNDEIVKNALAYDLGSELHMQWCMGELERFYSRAKKLYSEGCSIRDAYEKACFLDGKKRNEIELDSGYLVANSVLADNSLNDFNSFMNLLNRGGFIIKRYTKRNVSNEEIARGVEYNKETGEENILNPFNKISEASQKDNLEAARVAIELVYAKTMAGEQISPEDTIKMASIIHNEWLRRNEWAMSDPKLGVPFTQLSKEEQDKDIAQLWPARDKVQAYIDGKINIEEICSQYGLDASVKAK